jgi:hypothetical protein
VVDALLDHDSAGAAELRADAADCDLKRTRAPEVSRAAAPGKFPPPRRGLQPFSAALT